MSLIKCEVNLNLSWSADCAIKSSAIDQTTISTIIDTKFFVPVLTLSMEL